MFDGAGHTISRRYMFLITLCKFFNNQMDEYDFRPLGQLCIAKMQCHCIFAMRFFFFAWSETRPSDEKNNEAHFFTRIQNERKSLRDTQ